MLAGLAGGELKRRQCHGEQKEGGAEPRQPVGVWALARRLGTSGGEDLQTGFHRQGRARRAEKATGLTMAEGKKYVRNVSQSRGVRQTKVQATARSQQGHHKTLHLQGRCTVDATTLRCELVILGEHTEMRPASRTVAREDVPTGQLKEERRLALQLG